MTATVDLQGTPFAVENKQRIVVDFLNSKGVCLELNYKQSIHIDIKALTEVPDVSMDRVQAKEGFNHYINIKNEQTYVHDLAH